MRLKLSKLEKALAGISMIFATIGITTFGSLSQEVRRDLEIRNAGGSESSDYVLDKLVLLNGSLIVSTTAAGMAQTLYSERKEREEYS